MNKDNKNAIAGEVQLPHQASDIKPDEIVESGTYGANKLATKEIAPPPPAIEENDLPTEYHQPDPPAKIRKGPIARLRELLKNKGSKNQNS